MHIPNGALVWLLVVMFIVEVALVLVVVRVRKVRPNWTHREDKSVGVVTTRILMAMCRLASVLAGAGLLALVASAVLPGIFEDAGWDIPTVVLLLVTSGAYLVAVAFEDVCKRDLDAVIAVQTAARTEARSGAKAAMAKWAPTDDRQSDPV